jgi:hypothetical protein
VSLLPGSSSGLLGYGLRVGVGGGANVLEMQLVSCGWQKEWSSSGVWLGREEHWGEK